MKIRPNKFDFSKISKLWFDNNKFWTFFWNSNSIFFEHSEKAYIKTLSEITTNDNKLVEEIQITKAQENWHRYNHVEFNKQIDVNFNTEKMHKNAKKIVVGMRYLNLEERILFCSIFEAITVYIAKLFIFVCKNKKINSDALYFWLWHAEEEIEHGFVAKKIAKPLTVDRLKTIKFYFISIFLYTKFIVTSQLEFYKQHNSKLN